MRANVMFIGTGVVNDGRFTYFCKPFQAKGAACHVVSRFPEADIFGTTGQFGGYYVYDYKRCEREAVEHLSDLGRRIGATTVATVFEDTVMIGAKVRARLGLPGMRYEQAIRFIDKDLMKQRLSERGIPCAKFKKVRGIGDLNSFIDDVGFPLILKPLRLYGTISVTRANNRREAMTSMVELLSLYPEGVLAEQFIAGEEMSCDSIVSKGRIVYAAATRYSPTVIETMENKDIGLSVVLLNEFPAGEQALLDQLAQRVVEAMEIEDGFTHMELFKTPRGMVVGEIAARPPGARIVDLQNISQGINVGTVYCDVMMKGGTDYTFNRFFSSGVYFLSSGKNGVVRGVSGVDFLKGNKDVVEYRLPRIGQEVGPKANSCDDIGHVFFKSRSSRDIERAIEEARSRVVVNID